MNRRECRGSKASASLAIWIVGTGASFECLLILIIILGKSNEVGCSGCLPDGDLKGFSVFLLNLDPGHDSIPPGASQPDRKSVV